MRSMHESGNIHPAFEPDPSRPSPKTRRDVDCAPYMRDTDFQSADETLRLSDGGAWKTTYRAGWSWIHQEGPFAAWQVKADRNIAISREGFSLVVCNGVRYIYFSVKINVRFALFSVRQRTRLATREVEAFRCIYIRIECLQATQSRLSYLGGSERSFFGVLMSYCTCYTVG